jgi:hypothetical protein
MWKLLRSPEIDSKDCRTGPPGYKGWRNRFLGSLKVYKFGLWVQSHAGSSDTAEYERATDEAGLKKVLKNVTNVKYIRVQYYRYCICTVWSKVPFLYCTV